MGSIIRVDTTKDKVEFQYGTVEVRAKLPVGRGVWPAIWMLGHDIEEKMAGLWGNRYYGICW